MLRRLLDGLRKRRDRRRDRRREQRRREREDAGGYSAFGWRGPEMGRGGLTEEVHRQALDTLVEMLMAFEGFRANAYLCPGKVWTYGYGSTYRTDGSRVQQGDNIRKGAARELLRRTATASLDHAIRLTDGYAPTSGCLAAVASLIYNFGPSAVGGSKFLAAWKRRDMDEARFQFVDFNKVDGEPVNGLTRRREAEWEVLTGEEWKNVRF